MKDASALSLYLQQLTALGYGGDVESSIGARVAGATDNSIYQLLPDAILYPRFQEDMARIVRAAIACGCTLPITARGGGTGTNGQSLNEGLVVDTSRYLDRVIDLNREVRRVTVEPGIALERLNRRLAEHNLFFPPDVSSGSRATIGGMVATDASGKGSRIWGKTSDYIESLDLVLADGSTFSLESMPLGKFDNGDHCVNSHTTNPSAVEGADRGQSSGRIAMQLVQQLLVTHRESIDQHFPLLDRGLTGYNLKQAIGDGCFRPQYLLAGSEGTLALISRITLRVVPRPAHRALIVVVYDDFMRCLQHVEKLLKADPVAIEVLDDKILTTARKSNLWQQVESIFTHLDLHRSIAGLAFVELLGDDKQVLQGQTDAIRKIIFDDRGRYGILGHFIETARSNIARLWSIRRQAVGLLGARFDKDERRPLAFVEDTAVPPERLCDYIRDFRRLLDTHDLQYGMYGHADVGCLHVRPALNLQRPDDRKRIRKISDAVAALVRKYDGVFWGEHGKGFRGEYAPLFFGEELMPLLRRIKAIFDPDNRFNPGKLSLPENDAATELVRLDQPPLRGALDATIDTPLARHFHPALACNGNALCHNQTPTSAMCPSYKALHDKRHSPKGRAAMLREWVRLQSEEKDQHGRLEALTTELHASLQHCLSCKSCSNSCPLGVDIPEMKSRFLESYHLTHPRAARDHVLLRLEHFLGLGRKAPILLNALLASTPGKSLFRRYLGLVDIPEFLPLRKSHLATDASLIFLGKRQTAPCEQDIKSVILLPDSYTASFDGRVVEACCTLLSRIGYQVFIAPVVHNGKALHVRGFRAAFRRIAKAQKEAIERLAASGQALIGLDSATRMMHDSEYRGILGYAPDYRVDSLASWLLQEAAAGNFPLDLFSPPSAGKTPMLFPHCMEQTADQHDIDAWKKLFRILGLPVEIRIAGCCGMSGMFGHERENRTLSKIIFEQNWLPHLDHDRPVLATGFSCRCQLDRFGHVADHPARYLLERMR